MDKRLQLLYDANIHFTIESYYELGVTFILGDRYNGSHNYKSFDNVEQGMIWLWSEALKQNPTFMKKMEDLGTL